MIGISLIIFYLLLGIVAGFYILDEETALKKIWIGGVFGMMFLMWSHVPFSYFLGFTVGTHILGMLLATLTVLVIVIIKTYSIKNRKIYNGTIVNSFWEAFTAPFKGIFKKIGRREILLLCCVVPMTILAIVLLWGHTLNYDDGAYYTGQCTYGDMNMHLGFITSIAEQHMFPPTYSIMAGEPLNYPFLCDSISSSLYLFGTSLKLSYIIPMVFAFILTFMGVWFLAEAILGTDIKATLAYVFFLFDGGFGLLYFLDDNKSLFSFKNEEGNISLKYFFENLFSHLKSGDTNLTRIFTEFYETPTNLVGENVRWTNVVVDMLLPQRSTLFGWMALFAVIYILYKAVFENRRQNFLIAGICAGVMPMLHTHSYFAIGLIAIAWIIVSLIRDKFAWKTFNGWLQFGIPALLFSVPQLILWTFNAVGGESFLRFVFNWSNSTQSDDWLWFWIKNVGLAFILIPIAFANSDKTKKMVYSGGALIFLIAEFIVFQPNLYDNIKLFFIWYLFVAIMVADLFVECWKKLSGIKWRTYLAVILIFVMTISGALTMVREVVSASRNKEENTGYAYQLYNEANVSACEWISENTDPTSVFLCYNNHNNAISSLTGRNIFVGAGTFLYYHGVSYQEKEALMKKMLTDSDVFEENKEACNIDYVYIGDYERGNFGSSLITEYFRENYETVYSDKGIEIFKVKGKK